MLINCVAYQDGKKLADIRSEDVSDYVHRPNCFVYRTIDDLEALSAFATGRATGVVIGGGLLGLEAANALRKLGLASSFAVAHEAPRRTRCVPNHGFEYPS